MIAAFEASGPKRDDLADRVAAVQTGDVIDDVASATDAEVDIDVRQRDAAGVEKPLEEEVVLERIDVGDLETVGDQRAGRRASSRADRNRVLLWRSERSPRR